MARTITDQAGRGQHQVGGGARGVGGAVDGDADVGLLERRRVVDAVAGHADDVAGALQRAHDLELVLGKHLGVAVRGFDAVAVAVAPFMGENLARRDDVGAEPELAGDFARDGGVVAGDHAHLQAHALDRGDGLGGVVARRVEQRQQAEEAPFPVGAGLGDAEGAQAATREFVGRGARLLRERVIRLGKIEDDLRRALGGTEAAAAAFHLRLGKLVHGIERREFDDLVTGERAGRRHP